MTKRTKLLIAAGLGLASLGGGVAYAWAQDASGSLKASGQVGEKVDGYLGVIGDAPASVRDQVQAINIKRRALYTKLAQQRGATIEEVAAKTGCELIERLGSGQFYDAGGGWTRHAGGRPSLPAYCG